MMKPTVVMALALTTLVWSGSTPAQAEDHGALRTAPALATNAVHQATCGACHMPYPPTLLPAASWEKIIGALPKHNGETVDVAPADRQTILDFLKTHAADTANSGVARRVMRGLAGATPTRITEVSAIQRKHRGLPAEVFARKEIGSRANCRACHPGAEQGQFNDDNVRIPGGRPRTQGGREEADD